MTYRIEQAKMNSQVFVVLFDDGKKAVITKQAWHTIHNKNWRETDDLFNPEKTSLETIILSAKALMDEAGIVYVSIRRHQGNVVVSPLWQASTEWWQKISRSNQ